MNRKPLIYGVLAVLLLGIVATIATVGLQGFGSLVLALGSYVGLSVFGMILDERTEFADAVSVAKTAGSSYLIGDVIDTSVIRDLGNGTQLYFVITVDTEIITAGSAGTIVFKLASDSTASIATDGTATEHFVSRSFVTDDSAANDAEMNAGGVPVCIAIPMEGKAYERYLGVLVTVGTTDTSAGKINAFLTADPSRWKAYPDAL